MAIYLNVTGVVKLCKPEGYGYIVPDRLIGAHDKDVFFHAAALENTDWSKVKVGQRVHVLSVSSTRKGLQANEVILL